MRPLLLFVLHNQSTQPLKPKPAAADGSEIYGRAKGLLTLLRGGRGLSRTSPPVCCSVLQCVAVCCSVLKARPIADEPTRVLRCVAVYCSVL